MNWQDNIISDTTRMKELLVKTKTIAVLGMKTEKQANQPAFYVPSYLYSQGFEVIPVPVYYPDTTHILGCKVYRTLTEIPTDVDLVNVFRRAEAMSLHLEDLLAKEPKAVWMQLGIRHSAVAETLAQAGIKVVQDRCLMTEHQRFTQPTQGLESTQNQTTS